MVDLSTCIPVSSFDVDTRSGIVNSYVKLNGVMFSYRYHPRFMDLARRTSGQFGMDEFMRLNLSDEEYAYNKWSIEPL
ncbi:hypothetical protein GCM10028810_59050 [Spirosoma litoris]